VIVRATIFGLASGLGAGLGREVKDEAVNRRAVLGPSVVVDT